MANVQEYNDRIAFLEKEMAVANGLHKKDLARCVKRLKKELAEYRMYYKKYIQSSKK